MVDITKSIHTDTGHGVNVPDLDKHASWLKRLGIAGLLFFLIKGLAWMIVPTLIVLLN